MYTTSDIYPVSDFNRKTSEHIKRVQETKKPEVLTVNGKAAVVLVDPESYDQLAQKLTRFFVTHFSYCDFISESDRLILRAHTVLKVFSSNWA